MKRTLFLAAIMVATIGAVFVLNTNDPVTSYADEPVDENVKDLIQRMEEAVNSDGAKQSTMQGTPVDSDPTRSQASPLMPMTTMGNPYGCFGQTENPHLSENEVDVRACLR